MNKLFVSFWFSILLLPVSLIANNESILLAVEEPLEGSVYSGVSNIRGWAVAPQGLSALSYW
ncbi:MAG: hypothetical protein R3F37_11755 [Candidatus Competibacteraceae bacterium]